MILKTKTIKIISIKFFFDNSHSDVNAEEIKIKGPKIQAISNQHIEIGEAISAKADEVEKSVSTYNEQSLASEVCYRHFLQFFVIYINLHYENMTGFFDQSI